MRPIEAPKCARLLDEIELEMKREHVWQEALAGEREPPKTSQVHIHAVRNFDGQSDADALVQLLCDFDEAYMQEVAGATDFCKAAEQGSAEGQFNLGVMYADGRGVTQDIVSAHLWFYMAARAGNGAAVKHRDLAAAQMTPIQLSRAQDRAQRCINSNYKDFD